MKLRLLIVLTLLTVVSLAAVEAVRHYRQSGVPAPISLRLADWQAYEGAWTIAEGVIHDGKGGRGDKLITGDASLNEFVLSGDLRFDTDRDYEFGDAGFVFRASNISVGTDSMYGYYAGIRPGTNILMLGRMEDDFTDLAGKKLSRPVVIGQWYHFTIQAQQCRLHIQVADDVGPDAEILFNDQACVLRGGRIGLRAYSMVASWRNLLLQPSL